MLINTHFTYCLGRLAGVDASAYPSENIQVGESNVRDIKSIDDTEVSDIVATEQNISVVNESNIDLIADNDGVNVDFHSKRSNGMADGAPKSVHNKIASGAQFHVVDVVDPNLDLNRSIGSSNDNGSIHSSPIGDKDNEPELAVNVDAMTFDSDTYYIVTAVLNEIISAAVSQ